MLYEEVAHFNPIQKSVYEFFKKLNAEGLINIKALDALRMALTQIETAFIDNNSVLAEIFDMLKEEIILDKLLSPSEIATIFKVISLDEENLKSVAAYVEILNGNLDFDDTALDGALVAVHQLMETHHIYHNVMLFFFEESLKLLFLQYYTSKNFTRDHIFKVTKKVNNLTIIDSAEDSFENELRKCLAHIPRPTVANPLLQIHRNLEKCLPISYKAELAIMLQESV